MVAANPRRRAGERRSQASSLRHNTQACCCARSWTLSVGPVALRDRNPPHVAAKLLEAARPGEATADKLKQVGRKALGEMSTMWR